MKKPRSKTETWSAEIPSRSQWNASQPSQPLKPFSLKDALVLPFKRIMYVTDVSEELVSLVSCSNGAKKDIDMLELPDKSGLVASLQHPFLAELFRWKHCFGRICTFGTFLAEDFRWLNIRCIPSPSCSTCISTHNYKPPVGWLAAV